ncbi:Putative peroxiredoxin [Leucoagaricus sp. SymC.cos]|nr:Putative peroxiredoxin [Leucoagaricus sp. SymC.cos]
MTSITVNEQVSVNVGDTIPDGTLKYVPYSPELADHSACGIPQDYKTSEQWKGKKVVVVSTPGAFTPTCHQQHLPGFIKHYDALTKEKGVDIIVVLAANDPFVMSAWGRVEGLPEKRKIIYASDPNAQWSSSLGLAKDLTAVGFGVRTQRYVLILNNQKVAFIATEDGPGLKNSSAEEVLAHL